MTRPLSINQYPRATDRDEDSGFYAPVMRQVPRGHVSRNILASLVIQSESEIIRRLSAGGYMEDKFGQYHLTAKGSEIGIQKGKRIYFHLYRTTAAIGLTPKQK